MLGLEVRLVLAEGSEGPSLVGRPSLNLVAVGTVLWSAAEVHGVWGSAWQWQPARPCGGLRCLRPVVGGGISRGTDWTPGTSSTLTPEPSAMSLAPALTGSRKGRRPKGPLRKGLRGVRCLDFGRAGRIFTKISPLLTNKREMIVYLGWVGGGGIGGI